MVSRTRTVHDLTRPDFPQQHLAQMERSATPLTDGLPSSLPQARSARASEFQRPAALPKCEFAADGLVAASPAEVVCF